MKSNSCWTNGILTKVIRLLSKSLNLYIRCSSMDETPGVNTFRIMWLSNFQILQWKLDAIEKHYIHTAVSKWRVFHYMQYLWFNYSCVTVNQNIMIIERSKLNLGMHLYKMKHKQMLSHRLWKYTLKHFSRFLCSPLSRNTLCSCASKALSI